MTDAERDNVVPVENEQPEATPDVEVSRPWMAPARDEPIAEDTPPGLPTMDDLRAVSVDLDDIDEVLARLDAEPDPIDDPGEGNDGGPVPEIRPA